MDSIDKAYHNYYDERDIADTRPRISGTEADLQYILDNAFLMNGNDLFDDSYNVKIFHTLKSEDVKNPECQLLLDILCRTVSNEVEQWLLNPDTNLKLLYLLADRYLIPLSTINLDLLFQKSNDGITPFVFKEILNIFDEIFENGVVIEGLINWYQPIANSGVLHFNFIMNGLYDQYLLLSEQYSFDIYANCRDELTLFDVESVSLDKAFTVLGKDTSDKRIAIALLVLKNNFNELSLDEKHIFITGVKKLITDMKINTVLFFQIINCDDIFDHIVPELTIYFSCRSIMKLIRQAINIDISSKIIQLVVNSHPNKKTQIETFLILYSSQKLLDDYFGEYSQKVIDNVIKNKMENS